MADPEPNTGDSERRTIRQRLEALEVDAAGSEWRLLSLVANVNRARRSPDWPQSRRVAAYTAMARFFFGSRAVLGITLSLGAVIGGLLALQANLLLADQNQKLDLQSHLEVVNAHLLEAQRVSQLSGELSQVLALAAAECAKQSSPTCTLSGPLYSRIGGLSLMLRPYHVMEGSVSGSGFHDRRKPLDSAASRLPPWLQALGTRTVGLIESDPIPILSVSKSSPERGLLLAGLLDLAVDVSPLAAPSASFAYSELPRVNASGRSLRGLDLRGARLDGARLDGADLTSADLSDAAVRGASLQRAELVSALLVGTLLQESDLRGVKLANANLSGANLSGADLFHASIVDAVLAQVDDEYSPRIEVDGVDVGKSSEGYQTNIRAIDGMTCPILRRMKNWQDALREPDLACGQQIPERARHDLF